LKKVHFGGAASNINWLHTKNGTTTAIVLKHWYSTSFPSWKIADMVFFLCLNIFMIKNISYEGWNFNSGNYLFTTDTK